MNFKKLGNTELKVSTICLGTMTCGELNNKKDAFQQMDYALDQGINFFDTAELYAVPMKPETRGKTSQFIGEWFFIFVYIIILSAKKSFEHFINFKK